MKNQYILIVYESYKSSFFDFQCFGDHPVYTRVICFIEAAVFYETHDFEKQPSVYACVIIVIIYYNRGRNYNCRKCILTKYYESLLLCYLHVLLANHICIDVIYN